MKAPEKSSLGHAFTGCVPKRFSTITPLTNKMRRKPVHTVWRIFFITGTA